MDRHRTLQAIITSKRRKVTKTAWLIVGASAYALSIIWTPQSDGVRADHSVIKRSAHAQSTQERLRILSAGVIFLVSGSSWAVPVDCSLIDQVDCIGAGANGAYASLAMLGGGGGAFAREEAVEVTPGASISIQVGAGFDTVFGGTSLASCICGAAKATGRMGGTAAASVGSLKYSGGNGNNTYGGAGGAAGPNGDGQNATSYHGGDGDSGAGGAGGSVNSPGGDGTEYDAGHGSGGGAGGRNTTGNGRNGGWYGGGGGATVSGTQGSGRPGLIRVSYTPDVIGGSSGGGSGSGSGGPVPRFRAQII